MNYSIRLDSQHNTAMQRKQSNSMSSTRLFGQQCKATVSIPHICHLDHLYIGGEKIGHVEKFQISIHNRCGEIRNFARFGGISKFNTWQMWRNLKSTLFLLWNLFCGNLRYFSRNLFCCKLRAFAWKKIEQNRWRKNDKYEVDSTQYTAHSHYFGGSS